MPDKQVFMCQHFGLQVSGLDLRRMLCHLICPSLLQLLKGSNESVHCTVLGRFFAESIRTDPKSIN